MTLQWATRLSLFYSRRNQGSEKPISLPEVTQQFGGRDRLQIQVPLIQLLLCGVISHGRLCEPAPCHLHREDAELEKVGVAL